MNKPLIISDSNINSLKIKNQVLKKLIKKNYKNQTL